MLENDLTLNTCQSPVILIKVTGTGGRRHKSFEQ
jgi:hypothetical protein